MIVKNKKYVRVAGKVQRRQKGFGLIEVLIAVVIVSFGVLGMANLQLTGMKHSSGGFNRAKALLYAQSMATRIRLNSDAGPNQYKFNSSTGGFSCNTPPAPYCQATKTSPNPPECQASELAQLDTFTVACGDVGVDGATKGVVGSLPNGQLIVDCDSATCGSGSIFEVTVNWTEGKSRTNSDEMITRRVQVKLKP